MKDNHTCKNKLYNHKSINQLICVLSQITKFLGYINIKKSIFLVIIKTYFKFLVR